jgi:predicted O-methyltransferase YrrM
MEVIETASDLVQHLTSEENSIIKIKSRIIFEIIEKNKLELPHFFTLPFPPTQIGSITVFEATLLAALINIFDCKKIVEIGTYIGYSTAIIALNSKRGAEIASIDLPSISPTADCEQTTRKLLQDNWQKNDEFLRNYQQLKGPYYVDELPEEYRKKVDLIKCDSTEIDASILSKLTNADLVFIDGGHSYEIVENDTNLALAALKSSGLIIWHDFESKIHHEVTKFVRDQFTVNESVLHIENTMLAVFVPQLKNRIEQFLTENQKP